MVLLAPAPLGVQVGAAGHALREVPVPVAVRYTPPDGIERRADMLVSGPLPAGTRVPVWVDRAGDIAPAPTGRYEAMRNAVVGALTVLGATALVLGGIWLGVRRVLDRIDADRWEREWAQVEPQWSRRTPS